MLAGFPQVMKEEFDEEWLEGVQLHMNIQPRDREEKQDREAADIRNALKSFFDFKSTHVCMCRYDSYALRRCFLLTSAGGH
ncbi:hypothetical protein P5673_031870 [Acropora cervicornis]|uniref:Uncharacterized protein n=1 Tax=Acropora cervicornis TaxID=6130 RepID=A0AAD9US89_ACRCE|nr:hypothetical protein P5673_031870 [Acropora cervicornis]